MTTAEERARQFVESEQAFRLGSLTTEASHPKTRQLSRTAAGDLAAAVRMLFCVDEDIIPVARRVFESEVYQELVAALRKAVENRRRIFFTGCGATGRLSILLEAAWRQFWQQFRSAAPVDPGWEDLVLSVMAGGDFALIKSVEGFEDFPAFGRYQLAQAGVQAGDVVVAITEGGETPFVIGTAWEALDRGAEVFFVYNNPTELLGQQVKRSREVIEEGRIRKMELATGPMAVMGSTRMQAVTIELLVVGAALETALLKFLHSRGLAEEFPERGGADTIQDFSELLRDLGSQASVHSLSEWIAFEAGIYQPGGLVTYLADSCLLDVLTDTTERSPTFTLPPFRTKEDQTSPRSWAFVKNPFYSTEQSWERVFARSPRGLSWDRRVYEQLNAPQNLLARPPALDRTAICKFPIGRESDSSRTDAPDSALIAIAAGADDHRLLGKAAFSSLSGYRQHLTIFIGEEPPMPNGQHFFHFPCRLRPSPLNLWQHLAVKLTLNTLSTATMAKMERIQGNAMVWVWPSNKKLIDRGTRLIRELTGKSYEQSCLLLFQSMERVEKLREQGQPVPSPVALVVEEHGTKAD